MSYSNASAALNQCEIALRNELAAAAQAGDYAAIALLSQWAQAVSTLATHASQLAGEAAPVSPSEKNSSPPPQQLEPTRRATRPPKLSYPRFGRNGESLVKIGWSKKSKAEYEHKAPVSLAHQLASVAAKVGAKGRVFSIEALSTALSGQESPPSYQHYVIVAWWRDAELIDQHGRKGYSLRTPSTFVTEATRQLDALPNNGS